MTVMQIVTLWDQPLPARPLRSSRRRRSHERILTLRSRLPRCYI